MDKIEEIKFETSKEIQKKQEAPIELDNRIKVGLIRENDGKKQTKITIPENSRKGNTLILGSKLSGKSTYILPYLAKQDIQRKNAGCTFIISKKDLAYTLYAIAKMESKKKVHLIKPSCDVTIANKLLWDSNEYDYDEINSIIDFKEVIKKKEIVIIDMENSRYHQGAVRAVAKLLIQLQTDMQDVAATIKRDHFVYIDDAQYYLPFIDSLLNYGDDYNMYTTLFMQGRNQFKIYGEDYTSLLDNNIRNYILMNGINFDDAQYFAPMFGISHNDFLQRKTGRISIAYADQFGSMKFIPMCEVLKISASEMERVEARAKKERKKFVKESNAKERKFPLSNEERRGFNALMFEETPKEVKILHSEITAKEEKQEVYPEPVVIETTLPKLEIHEPKKTQSIIPDLDIEEETFASGFDDYDIDEPDFSMDLEVDIDDIEEPKETIDIVDEPQDSADDDDVIEMLPTSMKHEPTNNSFSSYSGRMSFAPRKRTEIERECVKDFYNTVLGDKLGGNKF